MVGHKYCAGEIIWFCLRTHFSPICLLRTAYARSMASKRDNKSAECLFVAGYLLSQADKSKKKRNDLMTMAEKLYKMAFKNDKYNAYLIFRISYYYAENKSMPKTALIYLNRLNTNVYFPEGVERGMVEKYIHILAEACNISVCKNMTDATISTIDLDSIHFLCPKLYANIQKRGFLKEDVTK